MVTAVSQEEDVEDTYARRRAVHAAHIAVYHVSLHKLNWLKSQCSQNYFKDLPSEPTSHLYLGPPNAH
jgi:hypothetical protein